MSEETAKGNKNPLVKYLLIGAIAVLAIGGFFYFTQGKSKAEPATISGQIDFNGIKPEDAKDPEAGEIVLKYRIHGENGAYQDSGVKIPFEDKAPFSWEGGELGKSYDLIAEVTYKDVKIEQSSKVTVTAPAEGIVLVFNVQDSDIPEEIRDGNKDPSTDLATVSGTIVINGFIPTGSYVNIYARKAETQDKFVEVSTNIPATPKISVEYTKAVKGEHYEYQAELYDVNGNFLGQSAYLTVTAPASNEVVIINSSATAPSQKTKISGNISLSGNLQQNSTILLLQRKVGESKYQVINRYPANRSIDYSWDSALAGTTYDITASLQVNETDTATGNVITVAAPATGVNIRIDTNFNLQSPTQTPTLSCGDPDQTNHFNAQISVPQISGAKKYYLQVGTSAGANNTFNGALNPNQSQTVYIPADSPYFTRYAYTTCEDCQLNESSNWSGWSPTLGFKCPK